MSGHKLLIDTNVFIGLEDQRPVDRSFAELVRKCGEQTIRIFIHEAARQDINRDKDAARRAISLSKIQKFEELTGIKLPAKAKLETEFGPILKANDEVDVALLYALRIDAVDFLVTQDQGIHDRVKLSPLGNRVFTVEDALEWVQQTFEPTRVRLPLVDDCKAHEIDPEDDIFESLRDGYPDFDRWWQEKCVKQHRRCWTATIDKELAGLVVRKDESSAEANTRHHGPKILKVCTFKVKPKFQGEKLGELLLKQILWYAQKNAYDLVYLTTFPQQAFLIQVLEYYGFSHTLDLSNGERVYEKPMSRERLTVGTATNVFDLDRQNYPRFVGNAPAKVFCVPIQGPYHQKLFPEIAIRTPLPLFAGSIDLVTPTGSDRMPGNTIRKVYLCRAKTTAIGPGDLLLFYQSKSPGFSASQAITSVGVVERVTSTNDLDELMRITAKRSVFSEEALKVMVEEKPAPVKVIDFLLAGHIEPHIHLADLVKVGVFALRPPQSICRLPPARFDPVRHHMNLGFEV